MKCRFHNRIPRNSSHCRLIQRSCINFFLFALFGFWLISWIERIETGFFHTLATGNSTITRPVSPCCFTSVCLLQWACHSAHKSRGTASLSFKSKFLTVEETNLEWSMYCPHDHYDAVIVFKSNYLIGAWAYIVKALRSYLWGPSPTMGD